jgi:hypothetical protein
MPVHIGEAAVDAVVPDREFGVINSELVQNRRVDVVDR